MDMITFLFGFIASSIFWGIVALAYNAGRSQSRYEQKRGEHEEQLERVRAELK